MISIVEHIEYLIGQYDCVVVPQLGAFIAQYEPARFDDAHIIPPVRRISFNAQVDHNDGILAVSLMKRHGISYDQAVSVIANEVAAVKRMLNAGTDFPVGSIGYLSRGKASVEFTPFRSYSTFSGYFGLCSFDLSPVRTAVSEAMPVTMKPMWKRTIQWAASIIIILGLGFMLSTPIVDNSHQQAGLNITTLKKPEVSNVVDRSDKAASQPQAAVLQPDKVMMDYQLVVATFATEKSANEFVALHPAMGLTVVKYGKYYRILAAQSDNQLELIERQRALPANMPSWIAHN